MSSLVFNSLSWISSDGCKPLWTFNLKILVAYYYYSNQIKIRLTYLWYYKTDEFVFLVEYVNIKTLYFKLKNILMLESPVIEKGYSIYIYITLWPIGDQAEIRKCYKNGQILQRQRNIFSWDFVFILIHLYNLLFTINGSNKNDDTKGFYLSYLFLTNVKSISIEYPNLKAFGISLYNLNNFV